MNPNALAHLTTQLDELRAVALAVAGLLGFLVVLNPDDDDPHGLGLLAACIGSFGLLADVVLTLLPT